MLSSEQVMSSISNGSVEIFPEPRNEDDAIGFRVYNLLVAISSGDFVLSKECLKKIWPVLETKDAQWKLGVQQDAEELVSGFLLGAFRQSFLEPAWNHHQQEHVSPPSFVPCIPL